MTIDERDFTKLVTYMRDRFGINLEKKRTLIEGRLSNTISQQGFSGFHDFLEDVYQDKSGDKIDELLTRLTTNYTYFMREDTHYNFMMQVSLPEWTQKISNYDIRTWSAGCSSGEEAYTTAMVMAEYFGVNKKSWDTTILATDISPRVLMLAKEGVYPEEHLQRLPDSWKKKYFKSAGPGHFKITPDLAKEVVFSEFNLMDNFSRFKRKFHMIFCRNVMIYFNNQTKSELSKKFYNALEPGGYLFIGLSETLSGLNDDFTQISPAIYKRER